MDVRDDIVKWARWGVENHDRFSYAEVRPMHLAKNPLPWTGDCSSFVTLCYYLAGAPDPNGLNYDGQGYTGTELQHGSVIEYHMARMLTVAETVALEHVLPGDAIVYGPFPGWHTALVVENGLDPLTVSMGQQGDPNYVRVSQDGREPQTYLRFSTISTALPEPTGSLSVVNDQFICKNPGGPGDFLCSWSTRIAVGIPSAIIRDKLIGLGAKRDDLDAVTFQYFKREAWKQ